MEQPAHQITDETEFQGQKSYDSHRANAGKQEIMTVFLNLLFRAVHLCHISKGTNL